MSTVEPDAKVTLECPVCGREFWRWRSQAKWRGARFCSRSCKDQGARPSYITCKQCNRRFRKASHLVADPGRGKFCSRACYSRWQEAHPTRVKRQCAVCGRTFEVFAAWAKRGTGRTCSRECAGIARRRGEQLPRRGAAWRELAAAIRERDGHLCTRCRQPEVERGSTGKVPALSVDHILPARLFEEEPSVADDPDNLASLCTACHGIKTHRYEPRILRGDFLAIEEFYDRPTRLRVMALLP